MRFHGMNAREDLKDGEKKIEAFLTHFAVPVNGLRLRSVGDVAAFMKIKQ